MEEFGQVCPKEKNGKKKPSKKSLKCAQTKRKVPKKGLKEVPLSPCKKKSQKKKGAK